MSLPSCSIVVPVFNESRNQLFGQLLESMHHCGRSEILFVDGGSTDDTLAQIASAGFRYILVPESIRAQRLNAGLQACTGDLVLLHHPRSVLTVQALTAFEQQDSDVWGGFSHRFDTKHPLLKFTSWYSNNIRFKRGIVYLDHCIFAPKDWLLRVGGVPEVAIFEDTELCVRLRRIASPLRINEFSTTSAIRFTHHGVWRQSVYNQWLKVRYLSGAMRYHETINHHYEAGLQLNGTTSKWPRQP